jgi:hypothetical protein
MAVTALSGKFGAGDPGLDRELQRLSQFPDETHQAVVSYVALSNSLRRSQRPPRYFRRTSVSFSWVHFELRAG